MSGRAVRAGRRAFIEDARANGQFLRVTWHPERHQFVVSNWADDVCVGATRVHAADAPTLISVLADGLADAAVSERAPEPAPATLLEHLRLWWRRRTARAAVVQLRHERSGQADEHRTAG